MNKQSAASGKVGSLLGTLPLTFQWAAGRLGTEFDTKTTGLDALLCCRCGMRCPSYLCVVFFFFKTLFVFMRGQRGKQYIVTFFDVLVRSLWKSATCGFQASVRWKCDCQGFHVGRRVRLLRVKYYLSAWEKIFKQFLKIWIF